MVMSPPRHFLELKLLLATSCATEAGKTHWQARHCHQSWHHPVALIADDGFLLLISVVSIALRFIAIVPGLLEQQREQLETD
jgi:hypothetical protein